jgi:Nickel responsive protein SCO4226-like
MKKYLIEREIPKVGDLQGEPLRQAAVTSNKALAEIGAHEIQWVESYVADNKTFCVYLAKDEAVIQKHAKLSGFPANRITEIGKVISPKTANELC